MLLTLTAALLIAPSSQPAQTSGQARESTRTTTTRTVTWRDPVERITVRAGERVRIVLTNPDARCWTALRPITRTVVLASSNVSENRSTFEYTTSSAARPNLEFRHPSGRTRTVKLTIVAQNTRNSIARDGTTVVNAKAPAVPSVVNSRFVFTSAHADKMVTVPLGQMFEIRLMDSAGSQSSWRPEPWPTDIVALKGATYNPNNGTQVYRLKAIARGTGDIDLVNQAEDAQTSRYRIAIRVK